MDGFAGRVRRRNRAAASKTMTRLILQKTGDDDNEQDATARQRDALPHQNDSSGGYFLEGHFKESGGHAPAYSATHLPHHASPQQHPARPTPRPDASCPHSPPLLQRFLRKHNKTL